MGPAWRPPPRTVRASGQLIANGGRRVAARGRGVRITPVHRAVDTRGTRLHLPGPRRKRRGARRRSSRQRGCRPFPDRRSAQRHRKGVPAGRSAPEPGPRPDRGVRSVASARRPHRPPARCRDGQYSTPHSQGNRARRGRRRHPGNAARLADLPRAGAARQELVAELRRRCHVLSSCRWTPT